MKKVFTCAVLTLVVAFCFGQLALAAEAPHSKVPNNWNVKIIHHKLNNMETRRPDLGAAPAAGLYGVDQAFVATPTGLPGNLTNNGYDLWPCAGGGAANSAVQDSNCWYIGSTGSSDPASFGGSWVLGSPAYVWYLDANTADAPYQPYGCAATTSADATNYCGQTNTFYEDWTNDSADDLTYLIEATQGTSVIADSGTVDFGPNSYGGSSPADIDVIIYGDQNFGTDGVATGPNNGNCTANYNTPIPNANFGKITSISESGTTATATVTTGSFAAGDYVYITGTSNANYNGTLAVLTSATATTLKWTAAASGLGSATGGQAITYYDGVNVYYPIIIAAGKTCVNPAAGAATLSATTEVATPKYTAVTSGTDFYGGPCTKTAPCYKETLTKKYSVAQKWNIFFR